MVRVGLGGVDVGWAESVAGVEEPRLLRGLKAEVDINRNCMYHNTGNTGMCLIGADAIAKEFVHRSSCYCFSSRKYAKLKALFSLLEAVHWQRKTVALRGRRGADGGRARARGRARHVPSRAWVRSPPRWPRLGRSSPESAHNKQG